MDLGGHDFFGKSFGGHDFLFTIAIQKKIISYFSFIATLVSSFVHENILFCFPISRFYGSLTALTKKVLDSFPVFEEKIFEVCILHMFHTKAIVNLFKTCHKARPPGGSGIQELIRDETKYRS